MTLIFSGFVVTLFSVLFYLEDRDGVGVYDPNSVHPTNQK